MRSPLRRRFRMVFVFDSSGWALRPTRGSVFRLGDAFYVADVVSGDLVMARPFHHYLCTSGTDIPVGEHETLFADDIRTEDQFEKEKS